MPETMYGFQICTIFLKSSHLHRIFTVSKLNDFKIVISGRDDQGELQILLEAEGKDQSEIYQKLELKLQNLKLFVNLYFHDQIEIKARYSPEVFGNKEYHDERLSTTLNVLQNEKNLSAYLERRYTQQHTLLENALDELQRGNIFNAFPKLVNWLDDNDRKGSSRFCCIRDASSHGKLDANRALKAINEKFPDEFEIEDNILKRNSEKNKEKLNHYLSEVLEHVRHIFREKYINS
ncbi:MAG: hypothetical protein IIA82_08785 [Thaumarchaeota archaeon]|nr:hypothetical protein [Nitrososphaerota archaeon]